MFVTGPAKYFFLIENKQAGDLDLSHVSGPDDIEILLHFVVNEGATTGVYLTKRKPPPHVVTIPKYFLTAMKTFPLVSGCLAILYLITIPVFSIAQPGATHLQIVVPVEREMGGGEAHANGPFLESDQVMFTVADQPANGETGEEIIPFDFETGSKDDRSIDDFTFGSTFQFTSTSLGQDKTIFVKLPARYELDNGHYPVLYILDGRSYFLPFGGIVEFLSMYEMIPDLIVVAIESGDRLKEFTYTAANEQTGDWPTSGDAVSFQQFLSNELIPFIDSTYRTLPFRILVGHSLAGLFALETVIQSPDLFQATITLSPSIYWNQFDVIRKFDRFLERPGSMKHYLFLSGETKDEEETEYLNELENLFKAKTTGDMVYTYRCFPEENHGSVALPALFSNLKQLYHGWQFPGEAWETGPEGIISHFQSLSERFGYTVSVPEAFIIDHAYHGLRRHDAIDEAIRLFEYALSLYPGSADAFEGMGEAYARKGEKERAREYFQRALEIDPSSINARDKLLELE